MAGLLLDITGAYRTADLTTKWPGGTNNMIVDDGSLSGVPLPTFSQSGARFLVANPSGGGNAAYVQSDNYGTKARLIAKTRFYRFNEASSLVMSFANPNGVGNLIMCAAVGVDNQGTYIFDGNGFSGAHILATGPVIPANVWTDFEFDVIFGTANNATCKLYINGNPTPFLSVTGVSTNQANGSILILGGGDGAWPIVVPTGGRGAYIDTYLFDGTGAAPFNAALAGQNLGAAKVGFAMPNGPGRISGTWTANGAATLWQCINEIPENGDTTYVATSTATDAFMCTTGPYPNIGTLIAVQAEAYVRVDDGGSHLVQTGLGNGVTESYSGVSFAPAATYSNMRQFYPTNPFTVAAWAAGDQNTLQVGQKMVS